MSLTALVVSLLILNTGIRMVATALTHSATGTDRTNR